MNKDENTEVLRSIATELGIPVFGVADVRGIRDTFLIEPRSIIDGLDYAIVIGMRLSDSLMDSLVDRPTKTYQYHYRETNRFLDNVSLRLVSEIQRQGKRAFPIPASQIIDWEKRRGHLSHILVGVHAGLGWAGRSRLLVNPLYGARVRYATVLTDMPLACAGVLEFGCGECRACIVGCPAGAIGETREEFNLQKCLDTIRLFVKTENIGTEICGLCVKACRGKKNAV
ncbi:MAG: hypothetical protein QME66_09825 [Candidatus Eisenbacteria bacterium]|nr:hypothetical protein [Candidatus Eisenbacteria bacterium]